MQDKDNQADLEALKLRRRRVALHHIVGSPAAKTMSDKELSEKFRQARRANGLMRGSVEIAART